MATQTKNTKTTTTTRIPAPLYAVAGAGDLAYQQLRKLPGKVSELRGRVSDLRPVVTEAVSETNLRADIDRLRGAARRNAEAFVAGAQDRAAAAYSDLVARGEKVVRNVRTTEASVAIVPADATVTTEVKTAPVKPAVEAKPAVKRTRSTRNT